MFQTSESCIKLHAVCVCVSTAPGVCVCVCPLQVCVCVCPFLWAAISKPSAIFGAVCKSLSALTVCGYNRKLYACISLKIHLLW